MYTVSQKKCHYIFDNNLNVHGAHDLLEHMEHSTWNSCFLRAHRAALLEHVEQLHLQSTWSKAKHTEQLLFHVQVFL